MCEGLLSISHMLNHSIKGLQTDLQNRSYQADVSIFQLGKLKQLLKLKQ